MSYLLPQNWSLESLLDYNARVSASLGAMAGLQESLRRWNELRDRTRSARDERDNDRWAVLSASAVVDLQDALWDHAVTDLSGRAFLAAGKDAVLGSKILALGKEQAHPDLAGALAALEAANASLAEAGAARDAAEEKSLLHEIRRRKLLAEYTTLVADSELAILTLHRGRRDLVRAALAPPRPKK